MVQQQNNARTAQFRHVHHLYALKHIWLGLCTLVVFSGCASSSTGSGVARARAIHTMKGRRIVSRRAAA